MLKHEVERLKTCPRAGTWIACVSEEKTTILRVSREDFIAIVANHCHEGLGGREPITNLVDHRHLNQVRLVDGEDYDVLVVLEVSAPM